MTQTHSRPAGNGAAAEQVDETSTSLSAGVTLRAVDALRGDQQTFTREQVAYLMHLAYDSGRTATYLDDVAELHSAWEDHAERRRTYEQRIADRLAEMERRGGPCRYNGGPVDWETGRPLRRAEPYSSPANGTTLGVIERDVIGRWAA